MTTDRVIEILLALMTVVIGYSSFAMATRTTRIERKAAVRAVDAGAFDRAKMIYEGALDTLRDELQACRTELTTAHRDLTAARNEIASLRADIYVLQQELQLLRRKPAGGP